jgi:SNF2 family DNA or RNA helicase
MKSHDRAAFFVGCGLGKTGATLQVLKDRLLEGDSIGALVVAPLRVVNLTWPAEVEKWDETRWMRVANLRTREGVEAFKKRRAHVYLINYDSLPKLCALLDDTPRKRWPFDTVVWDELTKAKNHSSKRINQARKYTRHVRRHYGLTGTPTPNSLLELFAQIRLLDEGERLGQSYHRFRQTWFYPTDYNEYNWVPREGSEDKIYKRLEGFALTLRSS